MAHKSKSESQPTLEWCVMGTLAWFNVLKRPLRLNELKQLLLKRQASEDDIRDALHHVSHKITEHEGYYSIRGTEVRYPTAESLKWYRYKWWRIRLAVNILQMIPYVREVAIANTVADQTAKSTSDIDVFIVVKKGRLYVTRLLITAALQVAGLRRHGHKVANRICLSFFITTEHLDLKPIAFDPYDIYLMYWITELVPVLDSGSTHQELMEANHWVQGYIPGYQHTEASPKKPGWLSRAIEKVLNTGLGQRLEDKLRNWQQDRIKAKPRNSDPDVKIVASESMLKFHEKERRKVYRGEWEALMKRSGYDPSRIQ